jgi:hypothetical protein
VVGSVTVQEWISENRYANSIPRRIGALLTKAVIELGTISAIALLLALAVDWFLDTLNYTLPPQIPETSVMLFLVFVGYGIRLGWCFTSDSP